MIYKHPSLLLAEAVVNLVMTDQTLINDETHIIVGSYQNGREQGLTISPVWHTTISIAEQRNSDKIVVYIGEHSQEGLSANAYNNSKWFSRFEIHLAAGYIIREIKHVIDREAERTSKVNT